MDYQNEKPVMLLHKNLDGAKRRRLSEKLELVVALKDVPLEVRRKEAKKPLFLIRYE
ncbi:MAG: hypothetical protein ABSD42_12315 [Candidatus Bathyarchaeia archaeon]|jgi:hypothetical protein